MAYHDSQSISGTDVTQLTVNDNNSSLSICNTHATDSITVDLFIRDDSTASTSTITSTRVLAAESEAISSSSVTLTVDTVAATADVFKNEKIYKSDATLFGTCTSVTNSTTIVFSGGLTAAITNNDILFTPARFYILNNVVIPNGTTLKLEGNEFVYDKTTYNLFISFGDDGGDADVIIR